MTDYSKNFENAMAGHTDPSALQKTAVGNPRTTIDDSADVRDLLSAIAGSGKSGLGSDQQAVYNRLQVLLGADKARKVISHAYIFNQRPDMLAKTPMQRISAFYDMGSNDPDVDAIIKKTKGLGEGPLAGLNQTPNDLTQKVASGTSTRAIASSNNVGDLQKSSGL